MSNYVFIESRDPFESRDVKFVVDTATSLKRKGNNVSVFLVQNGVLAVRASARTSYLKEQAPHANPVKGTSVEEEDHPTTRNFVTALLEMGSGNPSLTWINCGLCVDERGAGNAVEGVKRGGPPDFLRMAQESTNTLVIATR